MMKMKKYAWPVILLLLSAVISMYAVYSTHAAPDLSVNRIQLLVLALIDAVIFLMIVFVIRWRKKEKNVHIALKRRVVLTCMMVLQLPPLMFLAGQSIIAEIKDFKQEYLLRNLLLYGLMFLLLIFVLRNIRIAAGLFITLTVVIHLAMYFVYLFRGSAFIVFDLQGIATAAAVADGYQYTLPIRMGIILCLCMLEVIFFSFLPITCFYIPPLKKIGNYVLRAVLAGGCFAAIYVLYCTTIVDNDRIYFWDIQQDYREKGGIYTFLKEIRFMKPEVPENYSADEVANIAKKYAADSAKQSAAAAQTSTAENTPENLIIIMNESLADFSVLGEVQTDTPLLPYLTGMENVSKGYVYVPAYGGGTCNTEYEVLTGKNMQFLPAGCFAYQLYCRDPEYSIVNTLNEQGFTTIALHPSDEKNWNRKTVFREMMFDDFVSNEDFTQEESNPIIRRFVSDEAVYNKISSIIDAKKDGEKLFVFCVTIQNHGGYGADSANGYEPTVKLNDEADYPQAQMYLSLANESDTAFKNLIERYENDDEKTMIVMFGDHYPRVEHKFYKAVSGKSWSKLNAEGGADIHKIPYVIWTNYEMDEYITEDFSTNYLGATVLKQAGLQLTDYERFILQVKEKMPVISGGYITDAEGNRYAEEDLPQEYREPYSAYKMLQYNSIWDRENMPEQFYNLAE